jgi:hypothetical protein
MTDQNLNDYLGYRQHPDVSNSDLKLIKSPKKFKMLKDGLFEKSKSTASQELGTLIDLYFLDYEKFKEKCFIQKELYSKPTSPNQISFCAQVVLDVDLVTAYKNSYQTAKLTEEVIAQRAQELFSDLNQHIINEKALQNYEYYCNYENYQILINLELSVANHSLASKLLSKQKNTASFSHVKVYGLPVSGITMKGEIDRIVVDFDAKVIHVIDLKSTNNLSYFPYDYRKYKYYRQQGLYERLAMKYLKENNIISGDDWIISNKIIALETTPLYEVAVFPIPYNVIKQGFDEIMEDAATVAWHTKNDVWDYPRSYYENQGLTLIDWDTIFPDTK